MTAITAPISETAATTVRPWAGQTSIVLAAAMAIAVSLAYAHAHPGAVTDPALARLLRAMAAIKMLLAACAGAAVLWRLAVPAGLAWLAGYAVAAAATAAGPVLMCTLSQIGAGAFLLHGGLLATILLLWRDPVTGARLDAAIAKRQAR
jgi:hypothetical protein